ncbi:MAG: GDP-mannose 4,6-dehydratase [Bacteroidota bacterium]
MVSGKNALVTGGAGFIGSHLVENLLDQGWNVTVIDNFDPFYDQTIKRQNISGFINHPKLTFIQADIREKSSFEEELEDSYDVIVHLAAKAGVRPSLENPVSYEEVNVKGTQVLLELARDMGIKQFVHASSSSVYGVNPNVPWREADSVLLPISPYAGTKVSNELMGHVYSHLFDIRFIALRFFTVFGPRQRPDLAIHKFAKKILAGEEIPVFGDGTTRRDYTYVADIVQGITGAMAYTDSQYEIINLGNSQTVSLSEMISGIEEVFGVKAKINRLPMQPGDVPQTFADVNKAKTLLGYKPTTSFKEGLTHFKAWIESFESVKS